MRSSILGTVDPDKTVETARTIWNICSACAVNAKSYVDLRIGIERMIEPEKAATYWEQKAGSYGAGFVVGGSCAADPVTLQGCRGLNYLGGVANTLSDNYLLVGAVTVGLAAWFTYSKMNTYAAQERQAEENIKKNLADRFAKIANRLSVLESNQEVQECVKNILGRQLEINRELENLQLPNLSRKDIEKITQPVFDAAKTLQQKNNRKDSLIELVA